MSEDKQPSTGLENMEWDLVDRDEIQLTVFDSPSALLIYHEDNHPVLQLIHRLICKIGTKDSKVVFPYIREDTNSPLAEEERSGR